MSSVIQTRRSSCAHTRAVYPHKPFSHLCFCRPIIPVHSGKMSGNLCGVQQAIPALESLLIVARGLTTLVQARTQRIWLHLMAMFMPDQPPPAKLPQIRSYFAVTPSLRFLSPYPVLHLSATHIPIQFHTVTRTRLKMGTIQWDMQKPHGR
jgi:hypothetical protein